MREKTHPNHQLYLKQPRLTRECSDFTPRDRRTKSKRQSKKKFGYWRNSEQVKYITFLRDNYLIMKNAQLRAEFQIFKKMSSFIRSRDAIQCKSHHQKMLMKNDNKLLSIIKIQELKIHALNPQYLYREQGHENIICEHLNKIQTSEDLPYFMIKSTQKLLIVIDQRFMTSY